MNILEGILHRWNKTTRNYDIIHPETESARVTDWNQGIVNTLASTALGGLVNTLTSDSLLAKMIQKVLTATGVKYNIAQNGYLCFGSLFGGLIIQWVNGNFTVASYKAVYPISFSKKCYVAVANDLGKGCKVLGISGISTTNYCIYQENENGTWFGAIFIGK